MSIRIEQHIFRFQISVNDIQAVDVTYGEGDFCRIKACPRFREPSFLAEMEKEFPAGAVIEDKIELIARLKGHVHADNEAVLDVSQDTAFRVGMLDLVALDDVLLAQNFESVNVRGAVFADEKDFAWWGNEVKFKCVSK